MALQITIEQLSLIKNHVKQCGAFFLQSMHGSVI